jgi:hypothetical protein
MAGGGAIDAPVEEVFDLVADERNEPKDNPRIVHGEKVSQGPIATGARFCGRAQEHGHQG